jgi:phosphatidylethanolamine-binding protein (PEBP) family uncharacterized protein
MSVLTTVITPLGWMLRGKRPGEEHSVRRAPELAAPRTIELTSPAFVDGAVIPDRHCSMDLGPNVSPELGWSGVPGGTIQLLLIIEDIDIPAARPGLHTIALFTPGDTGIAEGALTPDNPRFRYVPTRGGRTGYFGPRPLPGHGIHHYGFHLYALDREIPAVPENLPDLLSLVRGHVLADGFIEGVRKG